MDTANSRNTTLDILKGIAIINIIIIHTVFWSGLSYINNDMIRQVTLLVDVPLFFFLSGWAATFKVETIVRTISRLIKLYIPYAIMIVVLSISLGLMGQHIGIREITGWLTFHNFDSLELPVVMASMWFLITFLMVYIFTIALQRIKKYNSLSLFFITSCIILIGLFTFTNSQIANINIYSIVTVRYLVFYLLFYFLGIYFAEIKISLTQLVIIIMTIAVVFAIFLYMNNYSFNLQENKFPPTLFYFVASLFSLVIATFLKNYEEQLTDLLKDNFVIRFLRDSGSMVFTIYLYQGFGASVLILIIPYFLGIINNWALVLVISLVVNLVITYSLSYIFDRVNRVVIKGAAPAVKNILATL